MDQTITLLDAPTTLAAPRFCRDCGTLLEAQSTECHKCALRRTPPPLQKVVTGLSPRDVRSSLLLYFTLLGIVLLSMLLGSASQNPEAFILVAEIFMSVVVIAWAAIQWDENLSGLLQLPKPRWFGIAFALSLLTFAIANGAIRGVMMWVGASPPQSSGKPTLSGYGIGMAILAIAVQPAVIEELAFRGIILGALRNTLKISEAIVVSAMMFMVLHLNPARFPHTLALGLGAGFIRIRSKSIWPCMLMHFCHNFLCVAQEWA